MYVITYIHVCISVPITNYSRTITRISTVFVHHCLYEVSICQHTVYRMMLSVLVEVYLYLMVGGCYHCVLAQQVLSPTPSPTSTPSSFPTLSRNLVPSNVPSRAPSIYPTSMPTSMPTYTPSSLPSFSPTEPLECANALFMTITLGPSSADAFDDFSTIEQWQNMTSSFIYDFYDGAINTAGECKSYLFFMDV